MIAHPADEAQVSGPAIPYTIPDALKGTYWGQLALSENPLRGAKSSYKGGSLPPTMEQLTRPMQAYLRATQGLADNLTEKDGQALGKTGWSYGQPAPHGYEYDDTGILKKKGSVWKKVGQAALIGGALAATIATEGAASPWLMAAVGAGTGLASAKLGGASWKQALLGAAIGGVTGGVGASSLSTATKVGTQAAAGAVGGAASGGGIKGTLLGAGIGAATAGAGASDEAQTVRSGVADVANKVGGGTVGTTLTQTLLKASVGAANGYAQGGAAGAAIGAVGGAAGASQNPAVAAAGQAGSSLASKILSGAQAASGAASAAASAREAGRATETTNLETQDAQRLAAQNAEENARQGRAGIELNQKQDARASENNAYKNALLSALALNTKDVSANRPSGVPTIAFSGGSRPSAIGAQGHQAAELANEHALDRLLHPESYTALPDLQTFTPSALPKATGTDTALGVGGAIGKALEAYQNSQAANQQSGLIAELLRRSQQDAAGGLTVKPAAPAVPMVGQKPKTLDELEGASALFGG